MFLTFTPVAFIKGDEAMPGSLRSGNPAHDTSETARSRAAVSWLRANLFKSPIDTLLTLFGLWLLYMTLPPVIEWAFIDAAWSGSDRSACDYEAACWTVVRVHIKILLVSRYPDEHLWRLIVVALMAGLGILWLLKARPTSKVLPALFMVFAFPALSWILIDTGFGALNVDARLAGGLFLSLLIAITVLFWSLAFGVLLAFGRSCPWPVIRHLTGVFIQFWRGIPFTLAMFSATILLLLVLGQGASVPKLLRVMLVAALFFSAHLAPAISAALPIIRDERHLVARSLGLGPVRSYILVIIPEAMALVTPAIINTARGVLKATTLVYIVGVFDFGGMTMLIGTNEDWLGFLRTLLIFAAGTYLVIGYALTLYGRRVERAVCAAGGSEEALRRLANDPGFADSRHSGSTQA